MKDAALGAPLAPDVGSRYFLSMTLLLLATVLVGFGSVLVLRPSSEIAALPLYLHVHGGVLLGWFLCLALQAALIQRGAVQRHRRFGSIAATVGAACVIAGPMATVGAVSTLRSAGLDWDSDMSAYPKLGIEGMAMQDFATMLVFGNLASVIAFGGLLAAAVICRRSAPDHKRLILLASLSIIAPALARISRWPGLGGEDGLFIPLVLLAMLLSLFLYDAATTRRIHRATWMGSLFFVVVNVALLGLAGTQSGFSLVRWLGGG